MSTPTTIHGRPVELLQHLVRFDTSNPPGNEGECIAYIDGLVRGLGIETLICEKAPGRPNLVARLRGRGVAPPLLLQAHVDVVTAAGQNWTHPPFGGDVAEACVRGRGTLDMKGGVAIMLAAFMRAKAEGLSLPGDVILCIVGDEETGGEYGADFLVEEHAELFEDVAYAIGEFGGFTIHIGGRRFYPIKIAEKQWCWLRATVRGQGGHGSMPLRGSTAADLGELLLKVDHQRLPVHVTPIVRLMLESLATELPEPEGRTYRQLLDPERTDAVLDELDEHGRMFDALLHNTVSPTIIRGGDKFNVIPAEISAEFDGRLLPGCTADDMIRETRELVGADVDLEVVRYDPSPSQADMGLFETLAGVIREVDPEGVSN